jgi:hypothetical protein
VAGLLSAAGTRAVRLFACDSDFFNTAVLDWAAMTSDPQFKNANPEGESEPARFRRERRIATQVAVVVAVVILLLSLEGMRLPSWQKNGYEAEAEGPPKISSVSPILAQANQRIVIDGAGFGLYTGYKNTNSPFIAIRDKTAGWSAGRIIPQNSDDVTVDVASWIDSEIVVSGFSGDYGKGTWKLAAGDKIEIAVWNPQSGTGPALYRTKAVASQPK